MHFGNGSAMRGAPVGWAFNSLDALIGPAAKSAAVTHSHPEGIEDTRAIAAAVFAARTAH